MWIESLMPEGALTLALPSRTKGEGLSVLPEVRRCLGARTGRGFGQQIPANMLYPDKNP
jgi:hypothetical protein